MIIIHEIFVMKTTIFHSIKYDFKIGSYFSSYSLLTSIRNKTLAVIKLSERQSFNELMSCVRLGYTAVKFEGNIFKILLPIKDSEDFFYLPNLFAYIETNLNEIILQSVTMH